MRIGNHILKPHWGNIVISKNKSFEYQFEFGDFGNNPFEFSIKYTTKQDHAGLNFIFSIKKLFWINFNIHDHRHWNYKHDNWQN